MLRVPGVYPWPVIAGHEYHVHSLAACLAHQSWEIRVKADHVRQAPVGSIHDRHDSLPRLLRISWSRIRLVVVPVHAAFLILQDGLFIVIRWRLSTIQSNISHESRLRCRYL